MSFSRVYHVYCEYGVFDIYAGGRKSGIWLKNSHGSYYICGNDHDGRMQLTLPFFPEEANELILEITQNYTRLRKAAEAFDENRLMIYRFCIMAGLPAIEITENFPAMALILARLLEPVFSFSLYRTEFSRLTMMKRKNILEAAGYPAENWVIKALKKLSAADCSGESLEYLHTLAKEGDVEQLKCLRHLKKLNRIVLKTVNCSELLPRIDYMFFDEVTKLMNRDSLPSLENDLNALIELVRENSHYRIRIRRMRTLEDVSAAHYEFIRRYTDRNHYKLCKLINFTQPPLEGLEYGDAEKGIFGIIPLKNGAALWEEGRAMAHCIGGYAERIYHAEGRMYAYHVQVPGEDPATMLISFKRNAWQIDEIRGPANHPVSRKTLYLAREWIAGRGVEAWSNMLDGKQLYSDD